MEEKKRGEGGGLWNQLVRLLRNAGNAELPWSDCDPRGSVAALERRAVAAVLIASQNSTFAPNWTWRGAFACEETMPNEPEVKLGFGPLKRG